MNKLIPALALILVGCTTPQKERASTQVESPPQDNPILSADDLAKAQGVSWWEVELPEITPDTFIGLAFQLDDGTIVPGSGGRGFSETDPIPTKVKVLVWDYTTKPTYRSAILWDTGSTTSIKRNLFDLNRSVGSSSAGETVSVGDPLVYGWYSVTNSNGEVKEQPVHLILRTYKK